MREATLDLRRREHADPRREELDRERDPVETLDDRGDGASVVAGELEAEADGDGARDEEPHRVRSGDLVEARARRRQGERIEREAALAVDAETLARRDDEASRRRRRKEGGSRLGAASTSCSRLSRTTTRSPTEASAAPS